MTMNEAVSALKSIEGIHNAPFSHGERVWSYKHSYSVRMAIGDWGHSPVDCLIISFKKHAHGRNDEEPRDAIARSFGEPDEESVSKLGTHYMVWRNER